ncbi:MAG: sulfur carrier protein ThiS [Kiritimatiellia bacterium]
MQVIVNGEACETEAVFLAELVREQGVVPERVAVVQNEVVVPAAARATTHVQAGDRIELLTFAGGG